MSSLIRAVDEAFLALSADVWMQLNATPLVALIALGAVVVASIVCAIACLRSAPSATPRVEVLRSLGRNRRSFLRIRPANAPVGARGPRAPGSRMPRPLPSY